MRERPELCAIRAPIALLASDSGRLRFRLCRALGPLWLRMLIELLGDPRLELRPVDFRILRTIRPQGHRVADVDVDDLLGRLIRIPMQQNADATPERAGHV